MSKKLRVIPLGGCGEIGKNMTIIEYGDDAIIIDAGIMFPENDMLGIDYIIPDWRYVIENRKRLNFRALLVTHGHEDHVGAIPYLARDLYIPIYGTSLTIGLVQGKLRNAGLKDHPTHVFKAGDTLNFGPFKVETFHVTHSIPDCVGFGVDTPLGMVMHTGDYKFDHTPTDGWPTDFARIASLSQRGVLALLADSTNAERPGWTASESVIDSAFDTVFRDAPGRILIATFASLISRVQQVAYAAETYGRKIAVAGYSMSQNIKIARKLGYLEIDDDMLIGIDEIKNYPPNKIAIMATGSQGEPSAVMGRLARGQHRQLDVQEGDTIIFSSHPIPGNEEVVYRITNKLIQRGAHVITEPKYNVHVSGHASQEEMKMMINLVRPKFMVPVHGELRHLHAHAELAVNLGIPENNVAVVENGQILEFTRDSMTLGDRIPGGYIFIDGTGIGDVGPAVLRDRETLGRDGFIVVSAVIDRKSGKCIDMPHIISRGFVYLGQSGDLLDTTAALAKKVAEKANNGNRNQQVESAVGKMLYSETKRRPMVFAQIHEV